MLSITISHIMEHFKSVNVIHFEKSTANNPHICEGYQFTLFMELTFHHINK
jgi:hypothetical protein